MLERGHDILYVLYDNNAYMNTGIQRSSATPLGASTTTAPAGKAHQGKEEFRKDITKIVAAHNIPYIAQASLSNLMDLSMKAGKAFKIKGPKFIVCLQPCTLGWRYPTEKTVELAKIAVESKFWPLYEIENGKYKLNYKPSNPLPVEDYLKAQGRFKHLFKPENRHIIETIQKHTDSEWDKLLKLCGE
jgi:pyruvate ferredoxin oxidoreductase beta subunit